MSIDGLCRVSLMTHDGSDQAVKVLIYAVIVLHKGLEALGQVCAQSRGIIISEGLVAQVKLMLGIVGEAGKFLDETSRG
jgi:hypothetical protein